MAARSERKSVPPAPAMSQVPLVPLGKQLDLLDAILNTVRMESLGSEVEQAITDIVDRLEQSIAVAVDLVYLRAMREVIYRYLGRSGIIPTRESMLDGAGELASLVGVDAEADLQDVMIRPEVRSYVIGRLFGESKLLDTKIATLVIIKLLTKLDLLEETKKCEGDVKQMDDWVTYLLNNVVDSEATCPVFSRLWLTEKGLERKEDEADFTAKLKSCLGGSKRYSFFDFAQSGYQTGSTELSGHSGLIFIDKKRKTYERFEPHGKFNPWSDTFVDDYFEKILPLKVPELQNYRYYKPLDLCPEIGPQRMQAKDKDCPSGGYCLIFSLVYLHLRLMSPDEDPRLILRILLSLGSDGLLSVVKRYVNWMDLALDP
jgi:hypothetical protein